MNRSVIGIVGLAALAFLGSACGMFKAAGELTLAEQEGIPRLAQRFNWPDIDKLTGSTFADVLSAKGPDGETLNVGLPTSLKKGTLAHVQGLLSLNGDCTRVAEVESAVSGSPDEKSSIKDIEIQVTNCAGGPHCAHICGGFQGMELAVQVEFQLLNQVQADKLKQQLVAANPENAADGIVQIRMQFMKLNLYQKTGDGDEVEITNDHVQSVEMVLNDAWGELPNKDGHETVVFHGDEFRGIDPQLGRRFELDPSSTFVESIKNRLVEGKATSFRVITRIRVSRPDLYLMRFDGAGVELDVQPEVVVSVFDVVGL